MNYIEYSIHNRIGFITLNRPEKRNVLSFALVAELRQAFTKAEEDEEVKLIVLKAKGEVFCAGADLSHLQQMQKFSYEENLADSSHLKELFHQIYACKKIVIAQVQGHALAGGCGLANVCDFCFAVHEAKFGYTEVRVGFIPSIVMFFLLRKIGEGKAKQLLLTGEKISAEQALHLGLVNYIVARDKLEEEVVSFAEKLITHNSSNAMRITKQMIAEVQTMGLEEALTFAAEMNAKARLSEDFKKGIASFLNKEKIRW